MRKEELIEKYEYLNHDCFRRVDTSEVLKDLKQLDEAKEKVTLPRPVGELDLLRERAEQDFTFRTRKCTRRSEFVVL
nr:hypothetical protein [uncultured Streptococcus sp.]